MKKIMFIMIAPLPIMFIGMFFGLPQIQENIVSKSEASPEIVTKVIPEVQVAQPDNSGGPIISFNFDDGFASAYQVALPILRAANFRASFYISTGLLNEKGYLKPHQVMEIQSLGHEIGAHTRSHAHLTKLTSEQAAFEIFGSKKDLIDLGIKSVTTFAYPYGETNETITQMVRDAGFAGARVTKPEFNDKNIDKFLLRRHEVQKGTTIVEIKNAIDEAIKNKKWLILLFHRIDEKTFTESVDHELLQQIVDYIKEKNIPVVTNAEGLSRINNID